MNRQAVPSILLSVAIVAFFAVALFPRDAALHREGAPQGGPGDRGAKPPPERSAQATGAGPGKAPAATDVKAIPAASGSAPVAAGPARRSTAASAERRGPAVR